VVGPADADVVDLVLAVAQLDDAVDDAARVGGECGRGGLVGRGAADDRARALGVVRRDPNSRSDEAFRLLGSWAATVGDTAAGHVGDQASQR
jgi:hypothetical protein